MVFGLSNTHSFGLPPNAVRHSMSERTTVSEFWFGTTSTCMNREYFKRPAKKMIFSRRSPSSFTQTSPKSNCAYSTRR